MQREIFTKIKVRADYPVSVSSSINGANIDAMAFNLFYIGERDAQLALEVMTLFDRAKKLKEKDK